ncbi:hypothetical protein K9U40_22310, partial [Xanthobacter autotrophicus]|uniref:hypothetical protein n=1 Tax=Xanthobacter autotrophicus TaxID=280 RepID=UPI0024AA58A5
EGRDQSSFARKAISGGLAARSSRARAGRAAAPQARGTLETRCRDGNSPAGNRRGWRPQGGKAGLSAGAMMAVMDRCPRRRRAPIPSRNLTGFAFCENIRAFTFREYLVHMLLIQVNILFFSGFSKVFIGGCNLVLRFDV